MGDLVRDGAIARRDDGHWVLLGQPPERLRHHRLAAALT
jgi:CRP/FNR family cyclic AMP-dependent transcriptional regulator